MIPSVLQKIKVGEKYYELFVPDPIFIRQAFAEGKLSSPYWSQVWPSAIALSLFLLQNEKVTEGRKVLELGAGLGLPSIVAAQWAKEVLCTDKEVDTIAFVQQSAGLHQLHNLTAAVMDWKDSSEMDADVVLLSDVNYDPENFQQLEQLINVLLSQGTTIILSTPQRLMAKEFITLLLPFCQQQQVFTVPHQDVEVDIVVMKLHNKQS